MESQLSDSHICSMHYLRAGSNFKCGARSFSSHSPVFNMLVIFWFGVFFDASLAAFTSFCFHPRQLHARGQSTMRDQIADFVCSLQLSPSDARLLTGELENDSSLSNRFSGGDSNAPAPITPVCRAAQLALGTDNVLIAPFNQTELEANWCALTSVSSTFHSC